MAWWRNDITISGGFPSQRANKCIVWWTIFFVGPNNMLNKQLKCRWLRDAVNVMTCSSVVLDISCNEMFQCCQFANLLLTAANCVPVGKSSYPMPTTHTKALYTRPVSQIPQCTCSISHNTPFKTEMCTFLFWVVHCGIWNRCPVEFVYQFHSTCCSLHMDLSDAISSLTFVK